MPPSSMAERLATPLANGSAPMKPAGMRRGDGSKVLAAASRFEKQVVGRPVELRRRDAPDQTEFGKARVQNLLHGDPQLPATPSAIEMRRLRPCHPANPQHRLGNTGSCQRQAQTAAAAYRPGRQLPS